MDTCTQCGAELGVGRFCTNCGHPVPAPASAEAWRTDTAERPRVTVPPMPDPPRGPLPADDTQRVEAERSVWFPPSSDPGPRTPRHRHRNRDERRWLPWVAAFAVLAMIGAAGLWLLLETEDEPSRAVDSPAASTPRGGDRSPAPSPDPDPSPTRTKPAPTPSAEATDLTSAASVTAPAPAPPSRDSSGSTVRYVATNMIDGIDDTAWRMPGDGTGASITFRLDSPTVLSEVGLINGYAKIGQDSAGPLDWYAGNRRILEVEWIFDDGTAITQSLGGSTDVQAVEIEGVETESVTLRLLEVSAPGAGRASRDFTAISDVRLVGTS